MVSNITKLTNTNMGDINTILERAEFGCLINRRPVLLVAGQLVIIPLDKLPELETAVMAWLENRKQWTGRSGK